MATIDTSIYGRVSPGADLGGIVRGYAAGQQIRGQQNENRLRDLAMAEKEGLNDAYRTSYDPNTGQINQNKLYAMMAERGIGSAIPAAQQAAASAQKARTDAQASDRANTYKMLEWARNGVTASQDPQSARNYLMTGVQYGFLTPEMAQQEAASIPDDPAAFMAWKQQMQQSMLSAQQQLDGYYKQQGLDIQRGRLELDRTAPRGQVVDTADGVMIVDPRSGAARPAQGQDGQPLLGDKAAQAEKRTRERQVEAIEAKQAVENSAANLDRLIAEAQGIIADPALSRITGLTGMLPNVPGGDAANVQARLETLKSQAGFAVLQAMRDASKTGGALGNVSNFEVQALQNNLAALDTKQGTEAFVRNLQQIIDYANGVKLRMNDAYTQQFGSSQPSQPAATQQQAQQSAPSSSDGIPTISSPQQLQSLASGTVFRAPDGSLRKVP